MRSSVISFIPTSKHSLISQSIKIIHSDSRGGCSSTQSSFLSKKGNMHQMSCLHIHNKMGVAERKKRHLRNCLALLLASMIPRTFWCEVAHTAVHLRNRSDYQLSFYVRFPIAPLSSVMTMRLMVLAFLGMLVF